MYCCEIFVIAWKNQAMTLLSGVVSANELITDKRLHKRSLTLVQSFSDWTLSETIH